MVNQNLQSKSRKIFSLSTSHTRWNDMFVIFAHEQTSNFRSKYYCGCHGNSTIPYTKHTWFFPEESSLKRFCYSWETKQNKQKIRENSIRDVKVSFQQQSIYEFVSDHIIIKRKREKSLLNFRNEAHIMDGLVYILNAPN